MAKFLSNLINFFYSLLQARPDDFTVELKKVSKKKKKCSYENLYQWFIKQDKSPAESTFFYLQWLDYNTSKAVLANFKLFTIGATLY